MCVDKKVKGNLASVMCDICGDFVSCPTKKRERETTIFQLNLAQFLLHHYHFPLLLFHIFMLYNVNQVKVTK